MKLGNSLEAQPAPVPELVGTGDSNFPNVNWPYKTMHRGSAQYRQQAELLFEFIEQ